MGGSPGNRLLDYPDDARLLIVNADDFGACQSVNEAVLRCFTAGVTTSTTPMTPWPGASEAMRMLREHPDMSFGVHLSVVCDNPRYRWSPLSPAEAVPSLVAEDGGLRAAAAPVGGRRASVSR
jgi:chitin disaccharide deacetylase